MSWGTGWRWVAGMALLLGLTHCAGGPPEEPAPRGGEGLARIQPLVTTRIFAASADAYGDETAPQQNHGSEDTLKVNLSPHQRAYLRFNVSGVTGTVTQARLRLYVTDGTAGGPQVYSTPDKSWSESTVAWQGAPGFSAQRMLDDKSALASGTWAEFDVSIAIHGNGTFGFILEAASADAVGFASRENSGTDRRPQLVLTVDSSISCLPRIDAKTRIDSADMDAYVSQGQPTQRFGQAPTLLVDAAPTRLESSLRFPSSSFHEADAWHVRQALLRLRATDGTSDGPRVYRADMNARGEPYEFDWNSRPPLVGAPLANAGAIAANTWVDFDVTSAVTDANGTQGFSLQPDSSDGVDFVSSNASTSELWPQLRVSLESDAYCTYRGTTGGKTGFTRQYGGAGIEQLFALGTDAQGGFVAAGRFGDAPFPNDEGFALARYTAEGTPLWTRQVTTARATPSALTLTPEGNILVVGTYFGALDLGAGALARADPWNPALFIAKFSPSGQTVWSRGFIAAHYFPPDDMTYPWPISPVAVATDAQGSLVVVGDFHGEVDLGGGVITAGPQSTYEEEPFPGAFIAKFTWQGQHVWSRATTAAPSEPWSETRAVSTDAAGNVFVAGRANSGADLGDGRPLSGSAPYIAKYTAGGALQWKRVFQGPTRVYGEITGVQPLSNTDVAFIADLGGTFLFNGEPHTGGEPGDQGYYANIHGFTGTLSAQGADKTLRGFRGTHVRELAAADTGGYTLSGWGNDVDLGGGVVGPPDGVGDAGFVARYTAAGAPVWSRSLDGALLGGFSNWGPRLAPRPGGSVLLGGDFHEALRHDGVTYTPRGSDLFYLRLNP